MRKICTFMAVLAVLFLYTGVSNATGLLTEDFNYTTGTTISTPTTSGGPGWIVTSAGGTNAITVSGTGLSFTGYANSGIGLAVTLTTSGEDDYKNFSSALSSGNVYASAMINVASAQSGGDYFFALYGAGGYTGRLYIKSSTDGGYWFGVEKGTSGAAIVYETGAGHTFGTTYLVVMKYAFNPSTKDDQVSLIVMSTAPPSTEPAATLLAALGTSNDATSISAIALRQGSSGTAPVVTVDGINAGANWSDVIPPTTPTLYTSPTSLTGFGYAIGAGPSASQSFALNGVLLTAATLTVTGSTHFEVSLASGSGFGSSVTVTHSAGTLSATTIYVRMKAGLADASYGPENIAVTGAGAPEVDVAASGTVVSNLIVASVASLPAYLQYVGYSPGTSQTYNLSGSGLTPASGNLTVTAPTNYEVSLSSGSGYASSVTVAYTGGVLSATAIYVRLVTGLAVGSYSGNVTNAGGGAATQNVAVTGSVVQPLLSYSIYDDYAMSYVSGAGPSGAAVWDIYGNNLSIFPGNITVTAPANFEVSTDNVTFSSQVLVAYTASTFSGSNSFYLRLKSGLAIGSYPGNLTIAGGGAATLTVALNGAVTAGGLLFSEDFSYPGGTAPADSLFGQDGWAGTSFGGPTTNNAIQVVTPGLSGAGVAGSGVGNAVTLVSAGGEDLNHQFTGITAGSVYASALVNVATATATGDYFIHFSDRGTYDFCARVSVTAATGGFKFGISKGSGTKFMTSTVYSFGTTYLIVLKYTFVPGVGNDYANLFVVPAAGGTEPTPDLTTDVASVDEVSISGIFLRQGSSSAAPTLTVDAIKVGQTWASVTPAAGSTLNLTAFIQGLTNGGGTAMTADVNPITVTVELHSATAPYAVVESKTGNLSTAGVGSFLFTTATNGTPYYIVVKSANSVETWSATAQSFTAGALSYDFTTAAGQAFGSNLFQIGSKWCIYSGDVNQDGYVDSGDMLPIDNDYTNYLYGTGLVTDVNGDSYVDSGDLLIVDNNYTNYIYAAKPDGAAHRVVKRQNVKSVVKNVQ
jgi:hypothetical protein